MTCSDAAPCHAPPRFPRRPRIEVVGGDESSGGESGDGEEEAVGAAPAAGAAAAEPPAGGGYGFDGRQHGVFKDLGEEMDEVMECPDPEGLTKEQRKGGWLGWSHTRP